MIDANHIFVALEYGLKGLPTTLYMTCLSILFGFFFGLIIAMVRIFEIPVLANILKYFVIIMRGIPIILIILVIYFFGSNFMHYLNQFESIQIDTSKIDTKLMCIIAFTLVAATRTSEIFRGAFYSISKGQIDAAISLGYTRIQAFFDIYLKQMIVTSLPMLANLVIGILKATSFASIIAVVEVLQSSLIPATINFNFFESYLAAGLILWVVALIVQFAFNVVHKKIKVY